MSMMNETNEPLVNEAELAAAEEISESLKTESVAEEASFTVEEVLAEYDSAEPEEPVQPPEVPAEEEVPAAKAPEVPEEEEIPAAEAPAGEEMPAAEKPETLAEEISAAAEVPEEPVEEEIPAMAEAAPAKRGHEKAKKEKPVREMPSVEQLEKELRKSRYQSNYRRVLRSTIYSLLVVAAVAVIIAVLLMPVLQISGISMSPTLEDGDLVVALNNGKYQTGDVVGFYFNNGILIKRVIATTGDWVDIDKEGTVYVNGVMLTEPYVSEKSIGECNINLPYQVPEGKCFVMGDHRSTSIDSRNTAVGCISNEVVVGKLLLRIWPFSVFGGIS